MFNTIKNFFSKQSIELVDNTLTNSLAPRDDIDNESQTHYEERLKAALKDKNIKNIALTGIYGSGKSTILNTFRKNNSNVWKFADVSLSTFDMENNKKLDSDYLQLIERSILQQLFYSVNYADIPLSRFKRIVKTTKKTQLLVFLVITTFVLSYLLVFSNNETLSKIIPDWEWLPIVGLILLLTSSLIILYQVLGYAISLKEIKLKLHDAEFNITNEENKSILNDHIDEIIYFFQETGKNVVIIEDLDRFDNTIIFVRLRELNALINASIKNHIVFIYAIKDNMFKDTERSKFFEYIIPVIPIINPTNAYDLIKENYKDIVTGIDNRFLRNTCLYFDDMRLLKNILNEYQDYTNHLNNLDLDKIQLFAMIVYKNHYPNEFADLNANKGQIYDIFNNIKDKAIYEKTTNLEAKIMHLKKKKEESTSENLFSINELNVVYSYFLNNLMRGIDSNITFIKIEEQEISIGNYEETILSKFSEFKDQKIQYRGNYYHSYQPSNYSFEDVEKLTGSNLNYDERLKAIKNQDVENLKNIDNEIKGIAEEVALIKNYTMARLLEDGIELDIPEQLTFFIVKGYIDENYTDYISLFVESSISKSDKKYTMIVNARKEPEFELDLKHPSELILNYLSSDEMVMASVLNIDMLRYLLGANNCEEHKKNLLWKICDKSDISVRFLNTLFNKDVDFLDNLIPELARNDNTVFDEILGDIDDEITINNYSKIISHIGDVVNNTDYLSKKLRKFLSKRTDYIDFVMDCLSHNREEFKKFSLIIEPDFKRLNATDIDLFNWLGTQDFFSIEVDMIKDILVGNSPLSIEEIKNSLQTAPLTTICQSNIDYLVEDFWLYTDGYVGVFIINLEDGNQLHEDEDLLIRILNVEELPDETKENLLSKVATKISNFTQVNEALYDKLFKYDVIKPTWNNIVKHFENSNMKLSENLIHFIDTNANFLGNQHEEYKGSVSEKEELHKDLEVALTMCESLENASYEKIIKVLNKTWSNIDFTSLSESKVLALISSKKLSLSDENWSRIISFNEINVRRSYVEHHIIEVLEGGLIEQLEVPDYITIMDSDRIDKIQKQSFIEEHASKVIPVSSSFPMCIIDMFDDKWLPHELYENIKNNATENDIQHLLLVQIDHLDYDEILSLLPLMGAPFSDLNEKTKTKFVINSKNEELLNSLHNKKVIVQPKKKTKIMTESYYETRLQIR